MELKVKIRKANAEIFKKMEYLGVLKPIINKNLPLRLNEEDFIVDTIYFSKKENGSHKLIYVKTNKTVSDLCCHQDKEDILLINSEKHCKPLIWVFSKNNLTNLNNKIKNEQLCSDDFIALNIPFNNFDLSFFTINEYYPHYEVTVPGQKEGPSFFVTEPSELSLIKTDLKNYVIELF